MGFNPESANRGTSGLTPPSAVTAFYHVLATSYMSEMATVLGNTKDAAAFVARHTKILAAYHARFYDASVGGSSPCVEGAVVVVATVEVVIIVTLAAVPPCASLVCRAQLGASPRLRQKS